MNKSNVTTFLIILLCFNFNSYCQEESKAPILDYEKPDISAIHPGCKNSSKNEKNKKCFAKQIAKLIKKNFKKDNINAYNLKGNQKISCVFTINKLGIPTKIRARAPHPELEKEAVRVLKKLPKMIPAKKDNENIPESFSMPIFVYF